MCRDEIFRMERVQRVVRQRSQIENAKVPERGCSQVVGVRQTAGVEGNVPVFGAHVPVMVFEFCSYRLARAPVQCCFVLFASAKRRRLGANTGRDREISLFIGTGPVEKTF